MQIRSQKQFRYARCVGPSALDEASRCRNSGAGKVEFKVAAVARRRNITCLSKCSEEFLKRRFETVSEMHSNGVDHAPWFVRLDPSSGEGGSRRETARGFSCDMIWLLPIRSAGFLRALRAVTLAILATKKIVDADRVQEDHRQNNNASIENETERRIWCRRRQPR